MSATVQDTSTQPTGRFWLASYPEGMPGEIAPLGHASIGALVESCCARYADRPAFTSMGKTLSFKDFEAASVKIAVWLQAQGLEKGDRVAVMMPNILQNPVIIFGILRAGLVVVNVNPLYTPRELEHQLKDRRQGAVRAGEFRKHRGAGRFAHGGQACGRHHHGRHAGAQGHDRQCRRAQGQEAGAGLVAAGAYSVHGRSGGRCARRAEAGERCPGDTAFLQYTGGTTGISKGATLTHANLLSNMEQIALWLEPAFSIKDAAGCARLHLRAAALPYLRADGERADGHRARRP
jgi:long-chain acyl-CoA synthetase